MKFDYCKAHAGDDRAELPCLRIRHDDGTPATQAEVWNEMQSLREANDSFGKRQTWWAERMFALEQERDALRAFAATVMEAWPLGDVDGADLQDAAVKHGLLAPETRTAPCAEEGCNCAGYYAADEWAEGITCYRRTVLLLGPNAI